MPELPEVEVVRQTLAAAVVGRQVERVVVKRPDVVRVESIPQPTRSRGLSGVLLDQQEMVEVQRHGKQLALIGAVRGAVCVHLGMSGGLRVAEEVRPRWEPHTHVVWHLRGGGAVAFRDARRFGGVWTFPDEAALRTRRWSRLGPDALQITSGQLHGALSRTRRHLKAALLDQGLVAGLGNIYVDELLFAVGLHPRKVAATITRIECSRLVRAMRRLLSRAIAAGGSTLRDYADADGRAGGFQRQHRVYGRGGQMCVRCRRNLATETVAGRTTVACPSCQEGAVG
ncbi:MAG: bifunctional DNA-formamidopyrimidine glycosylase/DNA-(apurinic or apyrimidinic site) lyase [Planctomycetota bacterium]